MTIGTEIFKNIRSRKFRYHITVVFMVLVALPFLLQVTKTDKNLALREKPQKTENLHLSLPQSTKNDEKIGHLGESQKEKNLNTSSEKDDDESKTEKCEAKHNIFYAKTHKCASSTMANIFLRYADSHNLSVAIGRQIELYSKSKTGLLEEIEPDCRTRNGKYNIFFAHWVFNRGIAEAIMYSETIYVTTIREPVSRYVSEYYYRGRTKKDLLPVDSHVRRLMVRDNRLYKYKNRMLIRLGYKKNLLNYLEKLDLWFHLVLIADYLDESLILMKELLCWSMDDIVYVNANVSPKTKIEKKLSNESYNFLRRELKEEETLYRYFLSKLQEKIKNFGEERMQKEVAKLRLHKSYWQNYCIKETNHHNNVLTEKGEKHPFCQQLILVEKTDAVKEKQKMLIRNGYEFPK